MPVGCASEGTGGAEGRVPVGFGPQRRSDIKARLSECRWDLVPGKQRERAGVIRVPVGFGLAEAARIRPSRWMRGTPGVIKELVTFAQAGILFSNPLGLQSLGYETAAMISGLCFHPCEFHPTLARSGKPVRAARAFKCAQHHMDRRARAALARCASRLPSPR